MRGGCKLWAGPSLVVLAGLGVGCAGPSAEPPPSGSTFRSRRGNFTAVVPNLIRPGARMVETYEGDNTFLSMSDDLGTLFRVESSPVLPEDRGRLDAMPADEALSAFFDRVLMPAEFLAASPQASVLHREMLDTSAGRTLFAVVDIPGGSTLASTTGGDAAPRRHDSVRGVFVFRAHDWIYVVSNQEPPVFLAAQPTRSVDDRAARLRDDLRAKVAGMTFH